MMKDQKDLNQWMLYKIILYNMTGENKRILRDAVRMSQNCQFEKMDQESHV